MNEVEWRRSERELAAWRREEKELEELLQSLARRPKGKRTRRLFANACCRRLLYLVFEERVRNIVEVSDLFADGMPPVTQDYLDYECLSAANALYDMSGRQKPHSEIYALQALHGLRSKLRFHDVSRLALASATCRAFETGRDFVRYYDFGVTDPEDCLTVHVATMEENRTQRRELDDILKRSSRAKDLDCRWLTAEVTKLAGAIYADRCFDQMPLLAAVLKNAGCQNEGIIEHCEAPRSHVRGCWVIDLLLGKR